LKRFVRQFAPIGLCLLASFPTSAVILEWDPNTETNLAGYRVYYGFASRNYTWTYEVNAPLTTATLTNLPGNRTYFFAITAFDADGLESEFSDEVSTTVIDATATNSIPIAIGAFFQTLDDQPRAVVLTGIDADGDSLQFHLLSLPLHGQLAGVAPNLTYTPDSGFYGLDRFLFSVTDGHTNSAPATVSILMSAVSNPPTLDEIPNLSVRENSGATVVTLSGITSGAGNEDQTLTVTAISSNPSLIPNPTINYFNPEITGTLAFTPASGASGTATITVTVDNGSSAFSRLFRVSVNALNVPPTLNPISDLSVNEDSGATVVRLSGISAGAGNEDQTLTVAAISTNPSLIPNPAISYFSPDSTGTLTFTPRADGWGTAIIIVTVNDGQSVNRTFRRFFRVTVSPVNDPPIVNAGADQTVTLPATAILAGSATDDEFPDRPGALTTSWSKLSGPGSVTFSAPGAAVSTASFSQSGQYILRLTASDGALFATDDVRVEVLEGGPPVIADLAIVGIDARSIVISLHTDKPAVGSAEFGTTTFLETTSVETALMTNHVMVLSNLQPATNYLVRILAVDGDGNASAAQIFTVTTPPVALMAWAADAGTLVSPMSIASDALGSFVWSPRDDEGAVSFGFQLPTASQYRVWCLVRTFADGVGSFYASFDDGAEFIFDAASSDWQSGWRWIAVSDAIGSIGDARPWPGFLNTGRHHLVFRANETVTLLYEVVLTNDPDWVPR